MRPFSTLSQKTRFNRPLCGGAFYGGALVLIALAAWKPGWAVPLAKAGSEGGAVSKLGQNPELQVFLGGAGSNSGAGLGAVQAGPLKTWTLKELEDQKVVSQKEKQPNSDKIVAWQGIKLSDLIDQAVKNLSASEKASIDLIEIEGANGTQALVPRWFVQRYPMLVAFRREGRLLEEEQGPFATVVPWTSKAAKISKEAVPLESFFVSQVTKVRLSNYKDVFGSLYLKRRSDPAAVRGEKIFVQNCATCHEAGISGYSAPKPGELLKSSRLSQFAERGHPELKGVSKPRLDSREMKALSKYAAEMSERARADGAGLGTRAPLSTQSAALESGVDKLGTP